MLAENVGTPPTVFVLLAHEIRWRLLQALALSDYRVQELVNVVGRPLNLVSYHLKQLREHQLVSERRSSADARDVYYHLDLERLHTLYLTSGEALHPAVTGCEPIQAEETQAGAPTRILFLCTHNSARSQMAEALLRHFGGTRVLAFSAGSQPAAVHSEAVRAVAAMGIDISQQQSKHLDIFANQSFDYIITVCDRVREVCPIFPNDPERIHWSFADPAAVDDRAARERAFQQTAQQLVIRTRHLLTLIERKLR
jgi:ArsR family transcriptional regulator, arsenate/arsenite/antimonite-responsive transcriptional repressor / arsenate reductase (thioredoxin)